MRKVLSVATVVALTTAAPVFAADMAVKAPLQAPAPVKLWTGCYIGAHVGGVVGQDKNNSSTSYGSAGFVGGGQIGCDYEFAGGWVVGAEGRAAWSSLNNTHAESVRNLRTGIIIPSQLS